MQRHDATCEQTEKTFSFSGPHKALVIFSIKRSTISEISKKLLKDIFAECDRSSSIKNFTDRLNLGELQVDGISAKFTAESTKKYIPIQ